MTDQPEIPYEAFYPNGEPTTELTWTPPPTPEPNVFDEHIALVRQIQDIVHPTPDTHDAYTDFFPKEPDQS